MSSSVGFDYARFVARNAGYVDAGTQDRMRSSRLLIAGCGIGSSLAVGAARMGYENFILVDGDVVDAHNLNRQFYDFADVGRLKVQALRDQILRINPQARIEAIGAHLDDSNTAAIVARADIVFDTVDFLDLQAILRLHDCARARRIAVFTALSVGFGALVWYFPADSTLTLGDIIAPDLPRPEDPVVAAGLYAQVFARFVGRIAPHLDAAVVEQVNHVLTMMAEGRPCPAPQVAVGSFAIGAMALSMMHDVLAGNPVPAAPKLLVHSFKRHETRVVDVYAP